MSGALAFEPECLPLSSLIRVRYEYFEKQPGPAPYIKDDGCRFIGVDNRQQCKCDLVWIRSKLSGSVHLPMVQVVGDSGSPFDNDKIPKLQGIVSKYLSGCLVEYGYTASKNDANWLVGEYLSSHPEAIAVGNVVHQSIEALDSGWEGHKRLSTVLVLFDRLSPTRFGDDTWLSDGLMFKNLGDRILCLEGGPQALYQCTSVLARGIEVIAVTNLRRARFSAARLLIAFKNTDEHVAQTLASIELTQKQTNVVQWCLSILRESQEDITSLIVPVEV